MSGVRECHQGVMGHKVAEERLRESNKEFAYLTRESDIMKGRFIVSNLTKIGSVKHTVVSNSSAKKNYVNLEEASEVLEKVILSMEDCVNAIPPPDLPACPQSPQHPWIWQPWPAVQTKEVDHAVQLEQSSIRPERDLPTDH